MPLIAFVDNELSKELEKKVKSKNEKAGIFPEHEFVALCLRIGLNLNDLNLLTYVDVMKILVSYIVEEKSENKATQKDIDRLLG